MGNRLILILLLISTKFVFCQYNYAKPMLIETSVSGTFGELRPNHFHSGVDYRTFGVIGIPVYSIESGYISRIKIQVAGYGKAIYITHPKTGHTSVYAHLDKFSPKIEKRVKDMQYKRKSYTVDMAFKPNEIKVNKKDIIAYSGNTGSSMGPHLHFEIRDTKTTKPLNPMKNGFKEKDTKPPFLENIYLIPVRDFYNYREGFNHKKIKINELNEIYGDFGIGISAYDKIDNSNGKNGIYSVCLKMNNDTIYYRRLDDFYFEETRYINNLIHYGELMRTGNYIEKCFIPKNQKLSVYNFISKNGIIKVNNDSIMKFELILKDEANNTTKKEFEVISKNKEQEDTYQNQDILLITSKDEKKIETSFYNIFIPKNTFYNDIYLDIEEKEDRLRIGYNEIPLHKKISINFLDTLKYIDKNKCYIALNTKRGWAYLETYYKEGYFIGNPKELGEYTIKIDTIPPTILIGSVSNKKQYLNIYSKDEGTGVKKLEAFINNKWILCEYEYKKNLYRYNFDDNDFKEKKLILKVISEDYCGNKTELIKTIKR